MRGRIVFRGQIQLKMVTGYEFVRDEGTSFEEWPGL